MICGLTAFYLRSNDSYKIPGRESGDVSGSEGGLMPSDKRSLKTCGDHGRDSVVVHVLNEVFIDSGGGLKLGGYTMDYAFVPFAEFGATHRLTVTAGW